MIGKKKSINTSIKTKVFKKATEKILKYSNPLIKTIAILMVLGVVGALELNHISLQHAIIQGVPALILLAR